MRFNSKMIVIAIILALISFMCLNLYFSYSYVFRSKSSANVVSISTSGNLEATITYNSTSNLNLVSMLDSQGLAQNTYSEITISKNNVYSVFYNLNIGYAAESLPAGKTTSDLIPLEYIKVALYTMNGNTLSENPIVGPVRIADLPLSSANNLTPFTALYTLGFGTFETNSQSAKYALKTWIDIDTPDMYENYVVYLGMSVDQEVLKNKSRYGIGGVVKDGENSPVSGAIVSLQNGMIKATTNASGGYTLSAVPAGTWNLSVDYNDSTYATTIHIDHGSAVSLRQIGPNNGSANEYLQASAYTYYTTPYKIIKSTSRLSSSNNQANKEYTIPKSYELIGYDDSDILNITDLQIQLDTNNSLTLSITS